MVHHIRMGGHRNGRNTRKRNNKGLLQNPNNKKNRNKWKSRTYQIHKRV